MTRAVRSGPAKIGAAVAVAALGAGLVATSSKAKSSSSSATTQATSGSAVARALPSTTTTTVDSVPPGTPIDVGVKGLAMGSRGPAVLAVKQRLLELRYDPGTVDDRFDYGAYMAVIAFEKLHGMPRNGRVTADMAAAMVTDTLPGPLIPGAEPTRVEMDLTRQILFVWQDGRLMRILPISSGFGGHYCGQDGSCGIAITPLGAYRATSKIRGAHKSPLGELWDPVFFNGGIAIHGEPAVPATPASHGCVRIPMFDSVWMYNQLTLGTPVYVRDATHVPVPFNQGGTLGRSQPGGTPPTLPHPSTTVARPSTTPAPGSTTVPKPPSTPPTTKKP